MLTFEIRGEYITLDALLKALGWVPSGAIAKQVIQEGLVRVDGEPELRRGRKLRGQEIVEFEGQHVTLQAQRL